MFISLCGGKSSVAEYLIRFHNFRELQITPRPEHEHDDGRLNDGTSSGNDGDGAASLSQVPSTVRRRYTPSCRSAHAHAQAHGSGDGEDQEQGQTEQGRKVIDPTAASSVTTASGKRIAGKSYSCDDTAGTCDVSSATTSGFKNVSLLAAKKPPLVFADVDELKTYIFPRWRERFVTTHHWDEDSFEQVSILPFFLLVSVDAPISVRYARFVQ
ncbi:Deoxycytidine monophosphate (dCMP) deaminase [Ascosphaera aggregata]|nr:Deoxycytidine monophosphate (dCMP) deaminase [Ascosphaera aggregata]